MLHEGGSTELELYLTTTRLDLLKLTSSQQTGITPSIDLEFKKNVIQASLILAVALANSPCSSPPWRQLPGTNTGGPRLINITHNFAI